MTAAVQPSRLLWTSFLAAAAAIVAAVATPLMAAASHMVA
jgi:hypothetical protein